MVVSWLSIKDNAMTTILTNQQKIDRYDNAKKKARSLNQELLTEYSRSLTLRSKIRLKCMKCSEERLMRFRHFISRGLSCKKCKKLLRYNKICEIVRLRGGECLSTEYTTSQSKIELRCGKGHTWWSTPNNIKFHNRWCPKCAKNKRITYEDVKKLIGEKNGQLLTCKENYTTTIKQLKVKCNLCDYIWTPTYNNIKNHNGWCPKCAQVASSAKLRLSIEDATNIAKFKSGKCLSKEYKNAHSKLLWECKKGHQWEASYSHIKHSNSWCPICRYSKGETLVRKIFESLFDESFPCKRPMWLKYKSYKGLELDGYCETLKLAFEYQGNQHYELHRLYHRTQEQFKYQQEKDEFKRKKCQEMGITLIEIPEFKDLKKIDQIQSDIKDKCNKYLSIKKELPLQ
jgi:hypothetical protein